MVSKVDNNNFQINDRKTENSAHYEDVGHFTTDLEFIESQPSTQRNRGAHSLEDALVFEAQRQLALSNPGKRGEELWNQLTPTEQHKLLHNIASSSVNRPDMKATVSVNATAFTTFHEFNHNSAMNGMSYLDNQGNQVTISHAITASEDFLSDRTSMLRRVSKENKAVLAYAGRPDTLQKAQEQAAWMFTQERKQSICKGVEHTGQYDANNRPIYRFTYVVDSLLSSSIIHDPRKPNRHEQKMVEGEIQAFNALRANQEGTLMTDPKTGQACKVIFHPIFLQNAFSWTYEVNEILPDWISHLSSEKATSDLGIQQLKEYAQQFQEALKGRALNDPIKAAINHNLNRVLPLLNDFHSYKPEKKVLVLSLVAEALHLPLVIHCISSKDRTGVSIALVSALDQYRAMNKSIENLDAVLADETFKELFCANLMIGHQITNYAQGAQGEFEGEQLGDFFGYELDFNLTFLRLLPNRYLQDNQKILKSIVTFPLVFIAAIGMALAGLVGTLVRSVQEKNPVHFAKHITYGWIVDFARMLVNGHQIFSPQSLRKDIPAYTDRGFSREHMTYPLTKDFRDKFDQIEKMSPEERQNLIESLQNPNFLESENKEWIFFLNLERNTLEKMLQIESLARQIPQQTREFIAAVLQQTVRLEIFDLIYQITLLKKSSHEDLKTFLKERDFSTIQLCEKEKKLILFSHQEHETLKKLIHNNSLPPQVTEFITTILQQPVLLEISNRISQIASMPEKEYNKLMQLFQDPQSLTTKLSQEEQEWVLFLNQERNSLQTMINTPSLEKRLPERAQAFIAAAVEWPVLDTFGAEHADLFDEHGCRTAVTDALVAVVHVVPTHELSCAINLQ